MAEKKKVTMADDSNNDPNEVLETPDVVQQDNNLFQVGDSGNRPSDPAINTVYYSTNTGTRERYLGDGNWDLIDNLHG